MAKGVATNEAIATSDVPAAVAKEPGQQLRDEGSEQLSFVQEYETKSWL